MENRIRELRCEKGLKQSDLAQAIHVSQQTVSRMETGKNTLQADILIHLSVFFQVSVDYILNLTDIRLISENIKEVDRKVNCLQEFVSVFVKLNGINREFVNKIMEHLHEMQ